MRLVILVILILLALYAVSVLARRGLSSLRTFLGYSPPAEVSSGGSNDAQVVRVGELDECPVCGVHVLKTRMVSDRSGRYCSEECRRAARDHETEGAA